MKLVVACKAGASARSRALRACGAALLGIVLPCTTSAAGAASRHPALPPAKKPATATAAVEGPRPALEISCRDGVLSVRAERADAFELLEEVGRQCGFTVARLGLEPRRVTAELPSAPVAEALRELLARVGLLSYAEVYGTSPEGPPFPERLILVAWGGDGGAQPPTQAEPQVPLPGAPPPVPVLPAQQVTDRLRRSADEVPEGRPTLQERYGEKQLAFEVQKLRPDSLLGLAGVEKGDILLDVNGVQVDSKEILSQVLRTWGETPEKGFRFAILRKGKFVARYLVTQ